jgi:hypothetical protein
MPVALAASLDTLLRTPQWSQHGQQLAFNRAMKLYHHPDATLEHRRLARGAFHKLVRNYNRTWTLTPPAARFRGNNYNSGPNSRGGSPNSNSNSMPVGWPSLNNIGQSNNVSSAPAAAAAPNYSKASGAVKKWLAARPHTIHQNAVHIKLPANASDPVSYNNFKSGNEAVMVIKKRLQANGATRSKRTFYTKKSIGGLAATHRRIAAPHSNPVPWRTIMRMKGSDVVFKDPFNRRAVYRRDLMNVKFVA